MDGHDVRTAADGREAITMARVFQPDAVVLDVGLPDMDGYQVAKRMRETEGAREARLVAMTGYAPCEFSARAAAAGFDTFLVKPVTLTTLRKALAGSRDG
jgi:CheY-like chemotaxis protein